MMRRIGLGRRARLARITFALVAVLAALASILAAPGARGWLGAALALVTCAIALYDARHFVIPDALNALAFALAIAHAAALDASLPWQEIATSVLRAAVAGGAFLALKLGYRRWRGQDGIGLGDVKLAAVAGAWLDWFAILVAIEIAVAAALGVYLMRHYAGRRPISATHALPFGLYLAPAIWAAWLLQATVLPP